MLFPSSSVENSLASSVKCHVLEMNWKVEYMICDYIHADLHIEDSECEKLGGRKIQSIVDYLTKHFLGSHEAPVLSLRIGKERKRRS